MQKQKTRLNQTYDYIIAGAGCAGLSLLYHILQSPSLQNKKILVIDSKIAVRSDKTWCYWEATDGIFDEIVIKKWQRLLFKSDTVEEQFDLDRYTYKMIRSEDFFEFILDFARKFSSVTFLEADIQSFERKGNLVELKSGEGSYKAQYVFNSTRISSPSFSEEDTLLQHFLGWKIKTEKPTFDPEVATFMDFDVVQKKGATFFYFLPTDASHALVEYTLFTKKTLTLSAYESAIKLYLRDSLKLEDYEIISTEAGAIPMSLQRFKRFDSQNIVHLGTTGGLTKASTGYTFHFIQKHSKQIIKALETGKSPAIHHSFRDSMYQWYDRTLLDVLLNNRMDSREIFSTLFNNNPPEKILAFLNNESTFQEELAIMNSVPILAFLPAGMRQIFS